MNLLELLGLKGRGDAGREDTSSETVRAVVQRLERLEPDQARRIASFAYILGRVAHVDLEISREETTAMEQAVRTLGGLTEAEAVVVVEIAKSHNRLFGSTDNYVVTRDFAASASREERMTLLECMFAVSAADSDVSGDEEGEIRRIATELGLERGDFLEARLRYREYIGLLQSRPGSSEPGDAKG
jgi:uncharacterized tellurite resistance protein B-like protein